MTSEKLKQTVIKYMKALLRGLRGPTFSLTYKFPFHLKCWVSIYSNTVTITSKNNWVFIYRHCASAWSCFIRQRLWHHCLSSANCVAWETWCLLMICYHRNLSIFHRTGSSKWGNMESARISYMALCLFTSSLLLSNGKQSEAISKWSTSGQNQPHSHISTAAIM